MTRASASFSVRPVALTWYSMAVASHWPVSSWATSTSNFMLVSVALRKCRVAGRCVGDRVVVLGGDGAAHTHRPGGLAGVHHPASAPPPNETETSPGGHAVRGEPAPALGAPLHARGGLRTPRR